MFERLKRTVAMTLGMLMASGIAGPMTPTAKASDAVVAARWTPQELQLPEMFRPKVSSDSLGSQSLVTRADLSKLPLHFEENVGQAPRPIRYAAQLGSLQ